MKLNLILLSIVTILLTSHTLADQYRDLATLGYRWINVSGPYACHTEKDARQIMARRSDATDPNVVQKIWCYYLIPGKIVQVLTDDATTGMSEFRIVGVSGLLWTSSKFLSRRPIRDPYGLIETPEGTNRQSVGPEGSASPANSADENKGRH